MRTDPAGSSLTQANREPRIVVGIIYPTGSIYVTNKSAAIANVPGNVVHGCLEDISSISRRIDPLQARSTIGSFHFTVTDVDGELTDELRAQLTAGEGVGRREVRLYTGDTDDFTDGTWSRIDTYVVESSVALDRGSYRFSCADRQRQLRERIFPSVTTRLVADFSAAETTSIEVSSTDGFDLVPHTASFSDAPSASVLYFRIKKTGEIIRATGVATAPIRFTGLTRERFNTIAQAVDVDPAADLDRQPEIELVYYLEMPVPQLVYALMTGVILDTGGPSVLPDGYHVGIDEAFLEAETFRSIGTDLYDPSDHEAGLVLFFSSGRGLRETDGKRFIEEQLLFPMWAYLQLTAEGTFVLRRLPRLLSSAAYSAIAFEDNIVSHGALDHQVGEVANRIIIHWNHDGGGFTRHSEFANLSSISAHGIGRTLEFELFGMVVARHTRATLNRIFDSITDRYGAPPLGLDLELMPTMNQVETGDILRVVLGEMRDFTALAHLDRSFEIEARDWNPRTGDVRVITLGSTARIDPDQPPSAPAPPLDDAWYSSEGVALNTVLTMSGDNVTANGNLAGNADLRSGVYYHLGDLIFDAGVTVTVNQNVQVRARGAIVVNGVIDGAGRGLAAFADPNTVGLALVVPTAAELTASTVGSTRGSAGLRYLQGSPFAAVLRAESGPTLTGAAALSRPNLEVDSGSLVGIPAELGGTPGIYGGPIVRLNDNVVEELGAAGGASGAGLMLVSRDGVSFGASGEIDLSGAAGAPKTTTFSTPQGDLYAGGGGGGSSGCLLIVNDGNDVPLPDLLGALTADHGATTQNGSPVDAILLPPFFPAPPWTGFDPGISSFDQWQSTNLAVWAPQLGEVGDSADEVTPAPTSLAAAVDTVGVNWTWDPGPVDGSDYTELWVATTNDRTGAVLVSRRKSSSAFVASSTSITRYGWVRNFKSGVGYSEWHQVSSTGGVSATYGGAAGPPGADGDDGVDAVTVSITADFVQWRQAPNGGSYSPGPTTTDLTFTFRQSGGTIATHVIRVTRSGATLTAATFSESGDATVETIVGSGTAVLTLIVQHTASLLAGAQGVSVVQGGDQGSPGVDGDDGAPGADGDDGLNNAVVYLYQRAASAPGAPSGTFTYTFSTGVLSGGTLNGWTQAVPAANGNPLWVIAATASSATSTDSIAAAEFTSPVVFTGAGLNTAIVTLYRRSAGSPTMPSGTFTYTFSTGVLSGGTLNSWTQTVPATDGNPLWITTATAVSTDATDSVAAAEFATAQILAEDGADGDDGAPGADGDDGAPGTPGLDAGNWVYTGAFTSTDADTVAWAAGTLKDTTGTSYSITGSNTGNMGAPTFVYWDPAVSTTAFQVTTTGTDAVGGGKILIATAVPSTVGDVATFVVFSGNPGPVLIAGDQLAATIAFLRDLIVGTGGKIRQGKTSAGSTTAGFWLGHDGSSNYDFHIGDATSYFWWDGSAATLKFRGLLDFAAQTFTPTWGGFSTAPSGDFSYIDFGSFVLMWTPSMLTGTSNGNTMNFSGVPAGIRPANNRSATCSILDNNGGGALDQSGLALVDPSGGVTFYFAHTGLVTNRVIWSSAGFSTTLTKGLPAGWMIVYPK